jgi:arylsulfatase
VPAIAKDGTVAHDCFWWFHDGNRALRAGDWKLVADHRGPWELYDLRTDRSESNNLAGSMPEKVKELEAKWTQRAEEFRLQAGRDLPLPRAKKKR